MPHEAYCVAYRNQRWSVIYKGLDLGAFYLRTNALKFAVAVAHRSEVSPHRDVYIHDRNGEFYTDWCESKDLISLDLVASRDVV